MKQDLNFHKISQQIILPDIPSYFFVREYLVESTKSLKNNEVLTEFIKSKYFLWQEDYRDKVRITEDKREREIDWNFHGLYDARKLSIDSFDNVTFNEFKDRVIAFVESEVPNCNKEAEIFTLIEKLRNSDSEYYIIKNLPDSYKHEWTIYCFFISGLILNKVNQNVKLVEFGLD